MSHASHAANYITTADSVLPLASLELLEYLRLDQRPTFIVDAAHALDASCPPLVFSNPALQADNALFHAIKTTLNETSVHLETNGQDFLSWLSLSPAPGSLSFCGLLWSSTCLRRRWTVVSGCRRQKPLASGPSHGHSPTQHNKLGVPKVASPTEYTGHESPLLESSLQLHPIASTTATGHDPYALAQAWGVKPTSHNLLVLGFDWSKTSAGSVEYWPQVLRQMVPYLLNGLQPGVLMWGNNDRLMIYNETYSVMIKALHPAALGSSARKVFGNFWDDQMEPQWRAVSITGPARHENTQVYLDRSGFLEETYFTYSLTPLWDDQGRSCAVDQRSFETTRQVVVEARMQSLLKISENVTSLTMLGDFWKGLVIAMTANVLDFPLFALYSLSDSDLTSSTTAVDSTAPVDRNRWFLRGSAGYPLSHAAIPDILDIDTEAGFAPAFRASSGSSESLIFTEGDLGLSSDLLRGCDTPYLKLKCRQIVVCPLNLSSQNTVGFLALGINPSRPYDDEYRTFVQLLSRQIETPIGPILSLVSEKIRSQMNAQKLEYEQQLLTTRLEEQTLEARRSESRFLRFAEQAPLGVYILGADGKVKFANDAWYKLAGIDPQYKGSHGWLLNIHPDDKDRVDDQWERLSHGFNQTDFEWRAIREVAGGRNEVVHLRSSCFPDLSIDGRMETVTGVLIDLSLERAQQHAQNERLKDALDAKRSQEYFMDMVSHEIRNPLHAVLQLAEESSSLLDETISGSPLDSKKLVHLRACMENIQTIMYCGHHQKQILDDVLTLSKLNSNMLTLSLTEVAPTDVVTKVLRFFDSDIRLSNIDMCLNTMEMTPGSQYPNVLMDSGRVLQILFNLVGNSIKFMKDRPTRKLTLTIKMSSTKPTGDGMRYLPSGKVYADPTTVGISAGHQTAYLYYSVQDTGPGLTPQEMDVLFERFKQVSPKTHTQYGGSGLGLFISRELAERHGGEIGLASVVDHGSTFAFYFKCVVLPKKEEIRIASPKDQQPPTIIPPARNGKITPTASIANSSTPTSPPAPASKPAILIVEDNIVNQKILNRQLLKLGYRTALASHGAEALTTLQSSTWWHEAVPTTTTITRTTNPPISLSLILCDLEMPIMDGMTFVRQVRQLQHAGVLDANIPVVALTGNARVEQIDAAKEAGFDDVVCKPYALQVLVGVIEKMTGPM